MGGTGRRAAATHTDQATARDGADVLTLAAGDLRASFAPRLGMAGVSLLHRDDELLDRRAGLSAEARTAALLGIPLLHPWANRLDAHEYELDGTARPLAGRPAARALRGARAADPRLLNASPHWSVAAVPDGPRLRATLDFGAPPI